MHFIFHRLIFYTYIIAVAVAVIVAVVYSPNSDGSNTQSIFYRIFAVCSPSFFFISSQFVVHKLCLFADLRLGDQFYYSRKYLASNGFLTIGDCWIIGDFK